MGDMEDVQQIVAALQAALGVMVPCGTITLNMNDNQIRSFETRVVGKVAQEKLDKSVTTRA